MTTTRTTTKKAYKGLPMEGPIATWYTKNVARDLSRFTKVAQAVANRVAPGSRVLEVAPGPGFLAIELAKTGQFFGSSRIFRNKPAELPRGSKYV